MSLRLDRGVFPADACLEAFGPHVLHTDAQMIPGGPHRGRPPTQSSTEREGRAAGGVSPGGGERHQTHHGRAVRARSARLERREVYSRWETWTGQLDWLFITMTTATINAAFPFKTLLVSAGLLTPPSVRRVDPFLTGCGTRGGITITKLVSLPLACR